MVTTVYVCLLYTVPSAAPKNLSFQLTEQQLTLTWAALEGEELNGRLLAYKLQWNVGGESQVHWSKDMTLKHTRCKEDMQWASVYFVVILCQ